MDGLLREPRSIPDVVDGNAGCYCDLTRIKLKASE